MSDTYVPTSIVCDHGRLRRQCADCEVLELYKQVEAQDKRIEELAAEIKLLETLGEEYGENLTKLNDEICRQQDELDKDEKVVDLRIVIDSQAKEIEKQLIIHEDYRRTALQRIEYEVSEKERLRNMIEIVLYHHPIVDDPIDYESAYDDLKQQINAQYEKNPWIIPAGGNETP